MGVTIVSGRPPVEPGTSDAPWVGWTTEEGAEPVDPRMGLRRPPRRPVEVAVSFGVSTTEDEG